MTSTTSVTGEGDGDGRRDVREKASAALQTAWRERLGASPDLERAALVLREADVPLDRLTVAVLAATERSGNADAHPAAGVSEASTSSDPSPDNDARRAAACAGRAASRAAIDFGTLHAVFGALREALFSRLIDERLAADEAPSRVTVDRCQDAAARAARPMAVAACEAWMGERGRAFRHDIKTPLQAASLNLELLALEGAGGDLDLAAVDVIQRSLEQAVEIVRRQEPDARASGS